MFWEDRIPILSFLVGYPIIPWQSRNSIPPVLSIKELVEKERRVIYLFSKQFATDVWEDRIPILSKVIVIRESLTESELCPPGP